MDFTIRNYEFTYRKHWFYSYRCRSTVDRGFEINFRFHPIIFKFHSSLAPPSIDVVVNAGYLRGTGSAKFARKINGTKFA